MNSSMFTYSIVKHCQTRRGGTHSGEPVPRLRDHRHEGSLPGSLQGDGRP